MGNIANKITDYSPEDREALTSIVSYVRQINGMLPITGGELATVWIRNDVEQVPDVFKDGRVIITKNAIMINPETVKRGLMQKTYIRYKNLESGLEEEISLSEMDEEDRKGFRVCMKCLRGESVDEELLAKRQKAIEMSKKLAIKTLKGGLKTGKFILGDIAWLLNYAGSGDKGGPKSGQGRDDD